MGIKIIESPKNKFCQKLDLRLIDY